MTAQMLCSHVGLERTLFRLLTELELGRAGHHVLGLAGLQDCKLLRHGQQVCKSEVPLALLIALQAGLDACGALACLSLDRLVRHRPA